MSAGSIKERFIHAQARIIRSYGAMVARNALWWIIIPVIVAAGLSVGLINSYMETNTEKLWTSPTSSTVIEKNQYDATYGPFYRINQVIFEAKTRGDTMLTKDIFLEVYDFHTGLLNNSTVPLTSVCMSVSGLCLIQSPIYYWSSREQLEQDPDVANTVRNGAAKTYPYGASMTPLYILGTDAGEDIYSQTAPIRGLQTTILVNNSLSIRDEAMAWEEYLIDYCKSKSPELKYVNIYFSAERSLSDEFGRVAQADTPLLISSYVIFVVIVFVCITRAPPVRSRFLVSMAAILLIGLAITASLGLTAAAGMQFSPITSQVLPFLILAIGTDNVFIFADFFHRGDMNEEERLGRSLHEACSSIVIIMIADTISFFLGALTSMPAVKNFCIQAGIAIIFNFILQITALGACFVLDFRRVKNGRFDLVPMFKLKSKPNYTQHDTTTFSDITFKKIVEKYLAPLLTKLIVKIIVIVVFAAYIAVCIWAIATKLETGLAQEEATPVGSYLSDFAEERTRYFGTIGPPVFFTMGELDYASVEVQKNMKSYLETIIANKWLNPGVNAWYNDFIFWIALNRPNFEFTSDGYIPPDNFYPTFNEFLTSDMGNGNKMFLVLESGTNKVLASTYMAYTVPLTTNSKYVDSMTSFRTMAATEAPFPSYAYSVFFVFFEQYVTLTREALQNLAITTGCILVLYGFLLLDIRATIIITINLILMDVCLIGTMALWGVKFNALSVVNIVMSTGIAVEFLAHCGTWFVLSSGNSNERMKRSLKLMGGGLFSGVISNLGSVIILAFARYAIIQIYYFRMFFLITILGLGFGFFLEPVMFSLVGGSFEGKALAGDDDDEDIHKDMEMQNNPDK